MRTIYMDESGYTGQDLFNPDQPIFVLASTDLSIEEAKKILEPIFKNNQGDELKHSRLGRRHNGQRQVVDLIKELQSVKGRVTTYPFHKKFVLFQKLVDQWLEPVMHMTGHDFYERGQNIAFCNMAYLCLIAFEGEQFVNEILSTYQNLMMQPTQDKYDRFWSNLHRLYEISENRSQEILDLLLIPSNILSFNHIAELGAKPQDISLTAALFTVSHWRKQSDDSITLIHDQSSNMSEETDMWEALTSPDLETMVVGHGDHREMIFPLNVVSTKFKNSKDYLQLQICDLVAGALSTFCHSRIDETYRADYCEHLKEAGILNFAINGIWPSQDIEPTNAEQDHGQADPLDFMGGVIADARSKRK